MKTVFIIGAGANVEIEMPSGIELKEDIIKALNFSSLNNSNKNIDILFAMQALRRTEEQIESIASIISNALPHAISIDNFIDMRRNEPDIALCGKLAIIYSILNAEKKCTLYKYINNGYSDFLKSWYPLFFQKISENCDINEFKERLKNISFIIFNYDRCFEYYMIHALKVAYGVSNENAENIVENMNIIHPYGKIGDLEKIKFGLEFNHTHLLGCATNIKTFTEDSDMKITIKKHIDSADQIIFLGFAYHEINLDLLLGKHDFNKSPKNFIECYGTGYDISEKDIKEIYSALLIRDQRLFDPDIANITCAKFFKDFWHRISFK